MIRQWLIKNFWPEFEDDEVIFKIKVKTYDQNYSGICRVKVYGYWKYKWQWFYTKLGVVSDQMGSRSYYDKGYGKYKPEHNEHYLELTKKAFIKQAQNITKGYSGKKLKVPVSELVKLIDNG